MSYKAEISRDNPSCFLFLIDQSSSMADKISIGKETQQLAKGVADAINRWLQELSLKCAKSEGIRVYYHVGVIGYGKTVGPSFVGPLAGRELIPINEIADNPARLDERAKKVIPVWFDPVANGETPMCHAAGEAKRILEGWIAKHLDSFPPVVINITDGESNDGDPTKQLQSLTNLSTSDGNVMLFNIHLSANPKAKPMSLSDSPDDLPDVYSKMLFQTASPLTPAMRGLAKEHGLDTSEDSHCFVLNADMMLLVQAIDIGTRPSNVQMEGQRTEAEAEFDVDGDEETADAEIDEREEPGWSGDDENPR